MVSSLRKIYNIFPKKDRVKFLLLFGMMLVASLLEVLGIGVIPAFIILVDSPDRILAYPVIGEILTNLGIITRESLIIFGALTLIVIYIFKNGYLAWYMYTTQKFVTRRGVYLQNRLFHAYMTAPYTFYINRNSAELLRNVTGEVGSIITGTVVPMLELALSVTMFTCIIAALMVFEPFLTLVSILLLGGSGFVFLRYTRKKTKEYGRANLAAIQEMNKSVLQGLGGFKEARILKREKLFLNEYSASASVSRLANVYRYVISNLPKPIIETLAVIGFLVIMLIMIHEGRPFNTIIPVVVFFGASAVKIMPLLNTILARITNIRYNKHSVDVIYGDLELLEKEYETFSKEVLDDSDRLPLASQIELKSITYRYPGSDETAIRDVSLTIEKGEVVAFVGPSGAGKTTIVDVILGLLEPESGRIEVDGTDIHSNISGWMKNVGYIPQSIYLMDDTIRRNITFGIPENEIDEEKLQNAIAAAQLEELIARLPAKDQTVVGERGVRLSGGQQQRIGIARALYNNPQVLIMDEATSALDNITEKYIIEAIEKLRGDRTIIMIAHRLTTVRNCDTIFMLSEGRLSGQGHYEELQATNPEFRKMSLIDD